MRNCSTLLADMPRIIRRALYQKLSELPELREFQRDFELLSGLRLALVDELGMNENCAPKDSDLCEAVKKSSAGKAMCARFRHGLFATAGEHPACAMCDAGLAEVVVPLRISGIPAGFLSSAEWRSRCHSLRAGTRCATFCARLGWRSTTRNSTDCWTLRQCSLTSR